MNNLVLASCLCLSLFGCTSAPTSNTAALVQSPAFQNTLTEATLVRIIERSKSPRAAAERMIAVTNEPITDFTVEALTARVRDSLGYAKLPVSEQVLVDAITDALAADLANTALTEAEKLAVVERWRGVALSAATRYLASE